MKRVALSVLCSGLLASCDQVSTITAPTAAVAVPAVAVVSAPPVSAAEPEPLPPPAPAPSVPVPSHPVPVLNTTPMGNRDCDFSGHPGSIRCYNRSDVPQTFVMQMNDLGCTETFGVTKPVTIQPRENGYFTLPMPPCGKVGQVDVFPGDQVGDCRAPGFAGEREYKGEACLVPPIVPPIVPPVECPVPRSSVKCYECHVVVNGRITSKLLPGIRR